MNVIKRLAALAGLWIALCLAACGTTTSPLQPLTVIKTVEVPVAVRCVPNPAPVKPDFVDSDSAIRAAPPFDKAKLYVVGRLQHMGYEGELEAALHGCTG